MLTPAIKKLYIQIRDIIQEDDNESFFIESVVSRDFKEPKEGFMSLNDIGRILQSLGNNLST